MVSDKAEVAYFLSLLQASDITDMVLSPGSRNAPFSISLWQHPHFRVHVVVDERSAGFIALGIAQQSGKAVVLVCTSGTAVLNYGPAIAEAFYQQVPIIVASADRPARLVDQGEGQTIRQSGVLQNIVRYSADILFATPEATVEGQRVLREAVKTALSPPKGPVHLNFPFEEPLYKTTEQVVFAPSVEVKRVWENGPLPAEMTEHLQTAKKVLLLAGQLPPDNALVDRLADLQERTGMAVMTESHSNLAHPGFISTIDRWLMGLNGEDRSAFMPDLLITFGGNIISRKIKSWLREANCPHWRIDEGGLAENTYSNLRGVVRMHPLEVVEIFRGLLQRSDYSHSLLKINEGIRKSAVEALKSASFSDLTVHERVLKRIPGGWDVQMGNSSVVRYIQLFDSRNDLRYFGNRGVSGIDGVTSTAVGAAWTSERPTLLITGDLAFLYDSNAFWNTLHPRNLKIVVINNNGGGIFRIIEGPSATPSREAYFETTHQRSAMSVAGMYQLPFHRCDSSEELEEAMDWLFNRNDLAILEVHTPREANDIELHNYFRNLQQKQ